MTPTQNIYRAAAAQIYGVPVSEVTKDQRHIGKAAVLALGFDQDFAPKLDRDFLRHGRAE